MTLADIQREFRAYRLNRPGNTTAVAPTNGHYAYPGQLIETLRNDYERLLRWLGDDSFEQAALWHIADHPPHNRTLTDYGADFGETLAAHYRDDPALADIARFEWSMRRALDGADADVLDPTALSAVNLEQAIFDFVPTLSVVTVLTNCAAIWSAIGANEAVPAVTALPEPLEVAVWKALTPRFWAMGPLEASALSAAREGLSFAGICDVMAVEFASVEAPDAARKLVAQWFDDGMIIRVDRTREPGRAGVAHAASRGRPT